MHSSSYYDWLGIQLVYELLCGLTRNFCLNGQEKASFSVYAERLDYFEDSGCRYFAASTDFHSPLMIPSRICAAVLPLRACS